MFSPLLSLTPSRHFGVVPVPDYSPSQRKQSTARIGTVLANLPDGILIADIDGAVYRIDEGRVYGNRSLPGSRLAIEADGRVRLYGAYLEELPSEMVDVQLLDDVLHGQCFAHPGIGDEYLPIQYAEEAVIRAEQLVAAGVLLELECGKFVFASEWEQAYSIHCRLRAALNS